MSETYYAAIDLGTNSCRLVVSDNTGHYVYNESVSTRLGEGMSNGNCFTPEAVARGLEALKEFGEIIHNSGCRYRAVATAACRMASNGPEFVRRVKEECGINLEVIDGHEEARLNLLGALANADESKPYVVVYDIGGGSTEITLARRSNAEIIHTISIPWGARNASEKFAINDYQEENAKKLRQEILNYTADFISAGHYADYKGQISFISLSSAPLRLSAYIHRRKEYNREAEDGSIMTREQMDNAIAELWRTTEQERAALPAVGVKRAPIFIAGTILLKTIYDSLDIDKLIVSDKSAKDSIILELIKEDKHGASE